ncbi:MAG: hypothetical protein KDJ47_16550 [Hyphomicrobiaceae bacterium]|nr:hypothetical protein [Hyphomicrobiaceae bacterium]
MQGASRTHAGKIARTLTAFMLVAASPWALPVHASESVAKLLETSKASTCFSRAYSAAHLAAHPRQQVAEIYLIPAPNGLNAEAGQLSVMLAVKLKGSADYMPNGMICPPGPATLTCKLEDDGGTVTLSVRNSKRLAVEPGPNGIGVEGASGMEMIAKADGDDRLFLLDPAPVSVCRRLVKLKW